MAVVMLCRSEESLINVCSTTNAMLNFARTHTASNAKQKAKQRAAALRDRWRSKRNQSQDDNDEIVDVEDDVGIDTDGRNDANLGATGWICSTS